MSKSTQKPAVIEGYDTSKVNTITDIRRLKTPETEPLVMGVTGCKGLKVYIEVKTGRTTFILMVKNPSTNKYKQLPVGDFDIIGSKENLTVEEARVKAEKVRAEYLKQVESDNNPTSPSTLTVNSLFSEVVTAWQKWYVTYHENPNVLTLKAHKTNLDCHILPAFGHLKFYEVNRQRCMEFLQELRGQTKHGATADKSRQILNAINDFAAEHKNIPDAQFVSLKKIIKYSKKNKTFVAPADLLAEYAKTNNIKSPIMKLACKLQHHIFLRSGETISKKEYLSLTDKTKYIVHGAKWSEIDFENKIWNVDEIRMKMGLKHTVPLSKQVLNLLKEIHKISGHTPFIFPNPFDNTKPMDRDRLAVTFRQYKIPYTAHDCRRLASDWMSQNGVTFDTVEVQLSHLLGNNTSQAYKIAPELYMLPERYIAMQKWSDYLESKAIEPTKNTYAREKPLDLSEFL